MGLCSKYNPLGATKKRRNSFIYTVAIPSDHYELSLPINNATYVNPIRVKWGDGAEETITSGTYPNHTYSTAGDFQIVVSSATGKMPCFYFYGIESARSTLKTVDFCDVTWYSGTTPAASFVSQFRNCQNLTSVSLGLFDQNPLVTSFYSCFTDCVNLNTIPAGLFAHNPYVTNFSEVFFGCTGLTSIPSGLFDNNPIVTSFGNAFRGCVALTSVPLGLFDQNPLVTSFYSAFYGCSSLASIPGALFANNLSATSFENTFYECRNAVLPEDLFCDTTEKTIRFSSVVPNFTRCFYRSLWNGTTSGTAPDLWSYTYADTPTITRCLGGPGNNADSLSNYGDIPAEWK